MTPSTAGSPSIAASCSNTIWIRGAANSSGDFGIVVREGDIFRACVLWSVVLTLLLCLPVYPQPTSVLSWAPP
jgi:L-lactate permease